MKIKTDGDLVRVAKQIDSHLDAIRSLVDELKEAEHPKAETFVQDLDANSLTAFAWAEHIVQDALIHPEKWETGSYGIRRRAHIPIDEQKTIALHVICGKYTVDEAAQRMHVTSAKIRQWMDTYGREVQNSLRLA